MKINKYPEMNQKEIKIMNEVNHMTSIGFPKLIDFGQVESIGQNYL